MRSCYTMSTGHATQSLREAARLQRQRDRRRLRKNAAVIEGADHRRRGDRTCPRSQHYSSEDRSSVEPTRLEGSAYPTTAVLFSTTRASISSSKRISPDYYYRDKLRVLRTRVPLLTLTTPIDS